MIEPRDEDLSRIYRDADAPLPAQRLDDAILAASRRAGGARPRPAGIGFARRWGTPFALAATVVVTFTLTLMVFERESDLETMTSEVPRADRPAKVSPLEPRRAGEMAKSSHAELPRAAPTPATPVPKAAARRDRAEQRAGESAASSERLGTGQPAFVPDAPRAPETLRQREEATPAPARPAPAASLYSSERAEQPVPAPAAAPASSASRLRESASTLQRAGAVSGIAAPEGKERPPEKWLEDIRKLKGQGKTTEAERELAEFKKRYPDYRLPEDFR